jgi:hypothetical protein
MNAQTKPQDFNQCTASLTRKLPLLFTLAITLAAMSARAEFTATIEEVGPDVIVTGNGSFNLTALTHPSGTGNLSPEMWPSERLLFIGSGGPISQYVGATQPSAFGPGGLTLAGGSSSGDTVGIDSNIVYVPNTYVSGGLLSDTSTYNNATFASLGVTEGTYVWSWGSGATADSFTLDVGAVPEPSTWAAGLLTAGALLCSIWRRRVPKLNSPKLSGTLILRWV